MEQDPAQLEEFTAKKIQLDYIAVPDPSAQAPDALLKPYDSVTVAILSPDPALNTLRR